MGGIGRGLLSMGTAGMWTPSSGKIDVDASKFRVSSAKQQKQAEAANMAKPAQLAAERRRRLAASRSRHTLRHDLVYAEGGGGLSIRGRRRATNNVGE